MGKKHLVRETNIELLRILGCLIVIATHVKGGYIIDGVLDNKKLLIASFLCDGVNIFWMITGFFVINNRKMIDNIKKGIWKVVLPSILFMIMVYFLQDWLLGESGIITSILYSKKSVRGFVVELTTWKGFILSFGGHLWYIIWYMRNLILWVPIIRMIFCNEENKTEKKIMLYLCCTVVILADIVTLVGKETTVLFRYFSIWGGGDLLTSPFLLILGCILYKYKYIFQKGKQWLFTGVVVFLFSNVIRYYMQKRLVILNSESTYFLMWYSGIGIISSCSMIISFLSIKIKGAQIRKVINYISGFNFGIYLLHIPVNQKLISLGITLKMKKMGDVWYILIYSIVVFALSLLMSIFFQQIKKGIGIIIYSKYMN